MLDPNKVKIGIAPIAWTEDDMPEMGAENSFLQTISEIAMDKCYAENKSFLRSIPEGVFTVPGDPEGCVDFPTVFKLLDEYNYEGWLVVEAEQDPAIANPLEYARMARAYVKEHTGL